MYGNHRCVLSGGLRVWEAGWRNIFRHAWFPQGLACDWRCRVHQICVGFLPIQYPWLPFPFINHLVMILVGWSLKVVSSKDQIRPRLHSPDTFLNLAMSGLSGSMWDLVLQLVDSVVVMHGLHGCGTWAQSLCGMWDLSFPVRNWTCFPCIAKWILNHWTTRDVLTLQNLKFGLAQKDWTQLISLIPKIAPWRDCLLKGQSYSGFWFSCPLQLL